ncbi:MAG: lysophospholipid acyltransferase family protein [Muribaculaceae bacterium]|nr:lysophospholipid acyltransferase family protein [Muribaculaceae bacterium]
MENQQSPIKRTVLDYNDIATMVPKLKGKEKFVNRVLRWLKVDKVNWLHDHNCDTPGHPFTDGLLRDLDITLRIDNEQVLDSLQQGAFITVSNHPFGALDGISLINIVGKRRPQFKVMVNMVLNYISAMRPNFIAVDAYQSDDPKKKAVSMVGIKSAIQQVRSGEPIGFFPAGAVSKITKWKLQDREWQENIIRLIMQLKVPVVPIFFHGRNSAMSHILGLIDWRLRTMRLPTEVFRKKGTTIHVSIGDPISVEEQKQHMGSIEEFSKYLRERTYSLKSCK